MVKWKDIIQITLLIIISLGIIYTGFSLRKGSLINPSDILIDMQYPDIELPNNPNIPQESEFNVNIKITPNPACKGDKITGTIKTLPNSVCRLWYQIENKDPEKLTDLMTNDDGIWSYTQTIDNTGTLYFKTICFNNDRFGISNKHELNIINCTNEDSNSDEGSEGEEGIYQGMPCNQVPPGQETCIQGACEIGVCTYIPASLNMPSRCECQ